MRPRMSSEYIIVREEATEEIRVCKIAPGYKPPPQKGYTWAGPFKSKKAAELAIREKSLAVYEALYGYKL